MGVLKKSSEDSWEPTITVNTTTIGYWYNWRVFLCALWALIVISFASFLVWKHEEFAKRRRREFGGQTQEQEKAARTTTLYDDETWTPCLRVLHPAWLLGFRIVAFSLLFAMLIVTVLVDGPSIYCYYTEWTSTLITIYFALGVMLSVRGCLKHHNRAGGDKVTNLEVDTEQGIPASLPDRKSPITPKTFEISAHKVDHDPTIAGFWSYTFQIIFQVNAGAVVLTDCVFWFLIAPFLMIKNYNLSFLDINMHTINVILLLGDTVLNSLHFPLFRIAYFFLWTITFVAFQWILHTSFNLWWPYPFLDLSSQYAPLWYLCVALLHFPCYGIFALAMNLKHHLLKKWFPQSYHCSSS